MKKLTKSELLKYGENIVFALGCAFILTSFFSIVMQRLDVAVFQLVSTSEGKFDKSFIYACVFAPIFEEIIFRWIPITFLMLMMGKKFENVKWHIAALLAIVFGAAHYGYFSIYIQGVFGFFVTYVYYNNRKYMYLSGVIMHMAWNFTLYYTLPTMINFPKSIW